MLLLLSGPSCVPAAALQPWLAAPVILVSVCASGSLQCPAACCSAHDGFPETSLWSALVAQLSGTMFLIPKWAFGKGNALSEDLAAETENKQMLSLTGKLKVFA